VAFFFAFVLAFDGCVVACKFKGSGVFSFAAFDTMRADTGKKYPNFSVLGAFTLYNAHGADRHTNTFPRTSTLADGTRFGALSGGI
jgi:hypothetical protein